MIITEEYLKSVRPEIDGKSDKYSWNIYGYLKKHLTEDIRVYRDPNKLLIIGQYSGDPFIGVTLESLVHDYAGEEIHMAHFWCLTELPSFLKDYQRIGRCLLISHDHPWYEGEDKRFTYVNDTRRCNWCGQWQHKEIHKKTIVKREVEWSDDK